MKPVWIHDLLVLWARDRLLTVLLEMGSDRVAQELPNGMTRRRTLHQITHDFVPLIAAGRRSRTKSPNPWAAYSRLFDVDTLSTAYLGHIINRNYLFSAAVEMMQRYHEPGDTVDLRDVRPFLVARFGDRGPVRSSANAILRTLTHFGVLVQPSRAGEYQYAPRLPVTTQAFALLVWSWWQVNRIHEFAVDILADHPMMIFFDSGSYADHWQSYDGMLWNLEKRGSDMWAILRARDEDEFMRILFNLLASHPRWPAVSRQYLEPFELG